MSGDLKIRIDLAYVGTEFHGWQIQPGLRTVQGDLRSALVRLLARDVMPMGAGRTDSGVHARRQVVHLHVGTEDEIQRIARALPGMMPPDIEIKAVNPADPDFNSRRSAVARRYSYHLLQVRDIFRPHAWYVYQPLDRGAMDQAAADFLGAHDFASFCKANSLKDDNVCDVTRCAFEWGPDSAIFHVRANRFLHHMVRNMVGTLVEIGRAERPADEIPSILAARRRSASGRMAPSKGLFLEEVIYPGDAPVVSPSGPEGETP